MICIYTALKTERRKRKKEEKERKKTACALSEDSESDQSFRCPHEESLGPYLPTERISKTMTWLGGCLGWSESSLGAKIILLV